MDRKSPPRQEPTLEQALNSLGRTTFRLEQLEAENAALRAQLATPMQHLEAEGETPTVLDQITVPTQIISTGLLAGIPFEQWNDLLRAHARLQAKFTALESQHRDISQKYRSAKERIRQWKDYLAHSKHIPTNATEDEVAAGHAQQPANKVRLDDAHGDSDRTPRAQVPQANTSTIENAVADKGLACGTPGMPSSPPAGESLPGYLTTRMADVAVQLPSLRPPTVTSSQTTVDDGVNGAEQDVNMLPVKAEPSSDGPVIVSARCLKRKISPGEDTAVDSRRVKREWNVLDRSTETRFEDVDSSQQTPQREMHPETSDLDALGAPIIRPRRPRAASVHPQRATSEELIRQVPSLRRERSSLSDGDVEQPADAHNNGHAPITSSRQRTRFIGQSDELSKTAASQGRVLQHPLGDVLQPISGNISRIRPLNDAVTRATKESRTRRTDYENKILLISEDGDDCSSEQTTRFQKQDNNKVATPKVRQRLEDLLNKPSPARGTPFQLPPIQDRLVRQRPEPPAHLITPVSTVKKSSPVKKPSPAKRSSPVRRAVSRERASPARQLPIFDERVRIPEGSPPPVRPEDEPLRIRPVETLGLSDFRINPAYMGTTFAFADPVRGKEQRKALPVCNQQGCSCASLRTAIRMGGTALSGKTDAGALEAYFGTEWRNLIGGYNIEERKEILIQAHAHCFANQHGKHRQAFERRSTPPGYWRTDFPTTQEQKDDHAIADERERKAVEERYREAMRTGGRWKFRDE